MSTVFTARRYALARSLLSAGVCPSVRLSVTFVYCIQTAEDIIKLLSQPGSSIILVFLTPSAGTKFQGEPFSGGAKYTDVGKLRYEIDP